MPITVNLRHLQENDLGFKGELSVTELDLDLRDTIIRAELPLQYDLQVQKLESSILLQGRLSLGLKCECVRCLKAFDHLVELKDWTRHVPLEGEEKAVVTHDCVDLTPYVREDILLELPQHPLCGLDCGGLPEKEPGTVGRPGRGKPDQSDVSAWAELDKLKL